jgi:hypothetical protein
MNLSLQTTRRTFRCLCRRAGRQFRCQRRNAPSVTIKKAFLPIIEKTIAMYEVAMIKDNHRCQWDKIASREEPN